jgi:hypothetical protein
VPIASLLAFAFGLCAGALAPSRRDRRELRNKALVRAAFERWRLGTGGPFELLAEDARWTIVGSSPLSRTYPSRRAFMDAVITPFNDRLSRRLVPEVRELFAEGDTVIILFDAEAVALDGRPYRNTYTWRLTLQQGRVTDVVAFFDTRLFDELWTRVAPASTSRPEPGSREARPLGP